MTSPAPQAAVRRPWVLLLPLAIFAALAGLFALSLRSGDASRLPSAFIGRAAPALALKALPGLARANGETIPGLVDADLRAGQVTLVNIFASWCGPCVEEHPYLLDLGKRKGVRLVGINYKDLSENALRFLGARGNPYAAVGVDPDGRNGIEWGVYGVPETFVVGPDGTVRFKQVGPITEASLPALLAEIARAVPAGTR